MLEELKVREIVWIYSFIRVYRDGTIKTKNIRVTIKGIGKERDVVPVSMGNIVYFGMIYSLSI